MTNPTGMMYKSASFSGVREKATFEKSRAGVKRETLTVGATPSGAGLAGRPK